MNGISMMIQARMGSGRAAENWPVIAIGGIPNKAQVNDMGIDGRIYPVSAPTE